MDCNEKKINTNELSDDALEQVTGGNSTPSVTDEGVLVIPATDGPMPQTREHTLL